MTMNSGKFGIAAAKGRSLYRLEPSRASTPSRLLLRSLLSLLLIAPAWALPGDINDSGRIDIEDLTAFSRAFGSNQGEQYWNDNADFDRDGTVTDADLAILAQYFGRTGLSQGVWVADRNNGAVVRLGSKEGNEVIRTPGFQSPESVSLDAASGVVWVADRGHDAVVKLSPDGKQELARVVGFTDPALVVANMKTHACWVADRGDGNIYRLSEDIATGYDITVDTGSHRSIAGFGTNRVSALAVDPVRDSLWVGSSAGMVWRIDVNAADGYDIAVDTGSHVSEGDFSNPISLSLNMVSGDCWVADLGLHQVIVLSRGSLSKLSEVRGFTRPNGLSVNSLDGTCWVADGTRLLRLGDLGNAELLRLDGFSNTFAIHADAYTGGCWVTENSTSGAVLKIAPGGQELLRATGFSQPYSLALTPGETIGTAPVASASADKETVALEETVTFDASDSTDDVGITLYEWDFEGDGIFDVTSDTPAATHAYTVPGIFRPVLRVTDGDWLTDTDISLLVRAGSLTAYASADPTEGNAPLQNVALMGSFVDPVDGRVVNYQWDFDFQGLVESNYASETNPNTTHTYTQPGTYTALFQVTDEGNVTATAQVTIQVNPSSPTANAGADQSGQAP